MGPRLRHEFLYFLTAAMLPSFFASRAFSTFTYSMTDIMVSVLDMKFLCTSPSHPPPGVSVVTATLRTPLTNIGIPLREAAD
ncbi:hypothetical protein BDY19DRAFT_973443 [Irpex rosettiformis]|uniref:Uncharacterized protein n=2 Tax=Irpex rosettiformis TaxID=378272 RepID=A0ACB8TQF9_9APHY|nr:hypothetical protein BDY19DRAFT_973035 [Irpex rosettiformis]KAI0084284.1 hypothetical protein BDY19DRAFT_973443 [Irpex rosettiformis]